VRQVVTDDTLGICEQLEADMAHHIASYRCEWKTTIEHPEQVARFQHFVNVAAPDPTLVYVSERGQKRPLRPDEGTNRVPVTIASGGRTSGTDRRDEP
jgi:nitrite reductase (NADH) large subunit